MKKITTILFLAFGLTVSAQSYDFSVTTETYQNLPNSTSLNNGQTWEDPGYTIPVGFTFSIGEYTFSTIYIIEDGVGGFLSSSPSFTGSLPLLIPIGQDIQDKGDFTPASNSQSPISYQLTGTTGNHILKIEWQNAAFLLDETNNDYLNFQVWLVEDTNTIEYHYGPNSVTNPDSYDGETGYIVGLYPSVNVENDDFLETAYFLTGNPVSPNVFEVDNDADQDSEYALNGAVPDGTVYRFSPSTTASVADFSSANIQIYPNPARETVNIELEQNDLSTFSIKLYNGLGQEVKDFSGISGKNLDISDLAAGVYFLKLNNPKESFTKKIIKN